MEQTFVNITRAVRPSRLLKLAKYVTIVVATPMTIHYTLALVATESWEMILILLCYLSLSGSLTYIGWSSIGKLGFKHGRIAFCLFGLSIIGSVWVLFNIVSVLIEQASTIANRTELMALFSAGFNISLIAIGCLVGIVGILWSRAAKIHHLNTKVIDLECRTSDLNVPIVRLRPRKPVQGYMCLVAALSLSIAVYYVPDEVFFHEDYSKAFRYWTLLTGVFVIYSRGFFQPSINELLENDRRSPILFLRSFGDEKWSLARNYQSQSGIFDFSLESRLASYFYNIGPFVAVSSPKIKYPYPGAIKAELDDDEWQDQIIAWMQSSQAIVLMIGTSHWLNWELEQVLTQGYSGKLILLFPEESGFLFFLRWRRTRNRFKNLCSIMSDTNWGPALQSIPKNQIRRIRSIILQENGNILVTTCSSKSREAYYIGAIVAHRTILNLENKNLADTGNGKYNEFAHREETQGSQSFGCIEE